MKIGTAVSLHEIFKVLLQCHNTEELGVVCGFTSKDNCIGTELYHLKCIWLEGAHEELVQLILHNNFMQCVVLIAAFSSLPPNMGDVLVGGEPVCCISRTTARSKSLVPVHRFLRDTQSQWRSNKFFGEHILFQVNRTIRLSGFEMFIPQDSNAKFALTVQNRRHQNLAQTEHTYSLIH